MPSATRSASGDRRTASTRQTERPHSPAVLTRRHRTRSGLSKGNIFQGDSRSNNCFSPAAPRMGGYRLDQAPVQGGSATHRRVIMAGPAATGMRASDPSHDGRIVIGAGVTAVAAPPGQTQLSFSFSISGPTGALLSRGTGALYDRTRLPRSAISSSSRAGSRRPRRGID